MAAPNNALAVAEGAIEIGFQFQVMLATKSGVVPSRWPIAIDSGIEGNGINWAKGNA